MMKGRDIFKIWAPLSSRWSSWVRPVPFIAIDVPYENHEFCDFTIPNINYLNGLLNDTAIIVDLPGYHSVKEGIALARMGFRPIPLYNGTNEQEGSLAVTNNHLTTPALIWGALELEKIKLSNDAPPAFLLDSNRMHRLKVNASIFDNSWDIYHQDLPSAEYFYNNGINKIIIVGNELNSDLRRILYKFPKKIKILFTNGYDEPKEITVKKPSRKDR